MWGIIIFVIVCGSMSAAQGKEEVTDGVHGLMIAHAEQIQKAQVRFPVIEVPQLLREDFAQQSESLLGQVLEQMPELSDMIAQFGVQSELSAEMANKISAVWAKKTESGQKGADMEIPYLRLTFVAQKLIKAATDSAEKIRQKLVGRQFKASFLKPLFTENQLNVAIDSLTYHKTKPSTMQSDALYREESIKIENMFLWFEQTRSITDIDSSTGSDCVQTQKLLHQLAQLYPEKSILGELTIEALEECKFVRLWNSTVVCNHPEILCTFLTNVPFIKLRFHGLIDEKNGADIYDRFIKACPEAVHSKT